MSGVNHTDQQFLSRATEITEANLHNEQFGVSELALEMKMSRASLHRKISSIAKTSASQFICQVRLKKALELLRQNSSTISETAYDCGFHSVTYFTKCFHDYYGYPPGEADKHEISEIAARENNTQIQRKTGKLQRVILFTAILLITLLAANEIFKIKPFIFKTEKQEKSIAVLPFINDSPDTTNVYFINGVTEAIINNLSAIKDLRVVSRGSTEQYRNNRVKTTTQIARELGVNYIIEGSGQKIGNQIKLSVQLIDAKTDKHLFSQSYERDLEEIFSLQSEIALSIASKINAVITPEETKQIEKKPTKNIAALNQYLKGSELYKLAYIEKDFNLCQQAEVFIKKAIQFDSTYADAYSELGWIFVFHYGYNSDSGLYMANRALHFDPKNPRALSLKGFGLMQKGLYKESEDALKQAIKYNPSDREGYQMMAILGLFTGDNVKSIEYYLKALKHATSNYEIGNTLNSLCNSLYDFGFNEEGMKFAEIQIEKNNDSSLYYLGLTSIDLKNRNDSSAYQNSVKARNWKSGVTNRHPIFVLLEIKDYKTAALWADGFAEYYKKNNVQNEPNFFFGFAYRKNGEKEKADYHFKEEIKYYTDWIEQKNSDSINVHKLYFYLMFIYSAMGDKAKAMENLRKVIAFKYFLIEPIRLYELKNHPIFETIRGEPEFQKYINDCEINWQPQREKIEKILKEYWSEN
jgi:TolB-like protein/AraC-like DNA-binding protein